jgi:ribosomal protein S18 acetylase RimI-like enzyme
MEIQLKSISAKDVAELKQLARTAFAQTFTDHNQPENVEKYLDASFTIEKLTEELNNENSQFFFALVNHEPVGYLKVNVGDAQTELKDDGGMELQRIYVLQDYHGKSVGQALFVKAKSLAIEGGYSYLWLGVWEENHRALNFYRKNGFVPFDKHIFKMGDEEQTDWMMKLEFKSTISTRV